MKPRKTSPEERAHVDRVLAEQDERRRQVAAGEEPSRRGHRSSTADGGDTPDDNPQHTEE